MKKTMLLGLFLLVLNLMAVYGQDIQNRLLGRWGVANEPIVLEFFDNGTFTVRNYVRTSNYYAPYGERDISIRCELNISGTYRFTANQVRLIYTEQGVSIWNYYRRYTTTRIEPESRNNISDEYNRTLNYSFDAFGDLIIDSFLPHRLNSHVVNGSELFYRENIFKGYEYIISFYGPFIKQ